MIKNHSLYICFLTGIFFTACGSSENGNSAGVNPYFRNTNTLFSKSIQTNSLLDSALIDASRTKNTNKIIELLKKGANPNAADKEGRTVLMKAAMQGNLNVVKILLQSGANINAEDKNGKTALFWANGSSIFRYLIEQGADVSHEDHSGKTLIESAFQSDDPVVQEALKKKSVGINFTNQFGQTLLMNAAERNDVGFMKFLLKNGADIDIRDEDKKTAVDYAMYSHHLEAFNLLREHGAKVHYFLDNPIDNLCFAAAAGDLKTVKKIIASGVNPDIHNKDGSTPLMWAAGEGQLAIVRYLVEHGVSVNALDEKYDMSEVSAVDWAVQGAHFDVIDYLVAKGANHKPGKKDFEYALFSATGNGDIKTVKKLIAKGMNVNSVKEGGQTLLIWACFYEQTDIAVYLVKHGAKVNKGYEKGSFTPLQYAVNHGNMFLVNYLLINGANPNIYSTNTIPPLNAAVRHNNYEIAELLLKHGAKTSPQYDEVSYDALMIACAWQNLKMVKLLIKHGADVNAVTFRMPYVTALSIAVQHSNTAIIDYLLKHGAKQ